MTDRGEWTLDELVGRVAVALAGSAYPGAPNGRVRELPDRRAVRWYTTTGLVDRPAMQGRTALYGSRHLLQIVAVKRRQAEGRSLAEIQAELAGATDETLRRVAAVPDQVCGHQPAPIPSPSPAAAERAPRRNRFWAQPPAGAAPAAAHEPAAVAKPVTSTVTDHADTVTTLAAVGLGGGALLLLPGRPADDDVPAIHAAARPLLELLAGSGLLILDEPTTNNGGPS